MIYPIVDFPVQTSFRNLGKKELRDYFAWFIDVCPTRVDILAVEVRRQFPLWGADFSLASLVDLDSWFRQALTCRLRTDDEIVTIANNTAIVIDIPSIELSDDSVSIAFDVGLYIAQVFLTNNATLRWDQRFGSKRDVNYGQPVLIEFNYGPFNPFGMLLISAYGVVHGSPHRKNLHDLYVLWSAAVRQDEVS